MVIKSPNEKKNNNKSKVDGILDLTTFSYKRLLHTF